ncbi:MAG: DEAD/DEAH box helicase [Chloroflexota bacterium]
MTVSLERFHAPTQEWFRESFAAPTRAQQLGWPEIQAGRSSLILAPTGSGKTLAAFMSAVDRLMFSQEPAKTERCRVLYVSPLRALAVDVERNLRAPLTGIARVADRSGVPYRRLDVSIRTGDTPSVDRARLARTPPDMLITTPESLFLMLTSNARSALASLEAVIVDEIHVLVGTKRGAHLALSLERLEELVKSPLQRIGLSATQRPLEEVARYLGGGDGADAWQARPVSIIDAGSRKSFDLRVEVPVQDMARLGEPLSFDDEEFPEGPAAAVHRRSIWPAIYPRLLELIRQHRSTIVFANSRRLAERIAGALNELAEEELVRAHHGSIAREQRLEIEDALKAGRLPAIIATSSLELGIDMGAVDLVIQIETPPSVASGMQRIGRASHQVEATSRGVIFPKYRGDLLATAAITRSMMQGAVEPTRVPANPLDVLAQQIVATCAMDERSVDELYALVRKAASFSMLPRTQFEGVLDMLAGRYPSDDFAELRPRLVWDRVLNRVRARDGARRLVVANAGTIPDRGLYGVFLAGAEGAGGRRVGELDEEMVFETHPGDVFILGASSWRVVEITRDRVLVEPAPGEPGRMPFWKGDLVPRPVQLGESIGRLSHDLSKADSEAGLKILVTEHALDPNAAQNLLAYIADQRAWAGYVPDHQTIVVERMRDELGDWRICILSPWGGRVNAPWAMAIQARLRASEHADVASVWSDDGIVIRLPDRETPPDRDALIPDPDDIEQLVVRELGGTALFAGRFREAAARALLLPRRRPGHRSPLWMQRKRSADLLNVAARYGSFPIILETFREVLQDVFDVPALIDLIRKIERRDIRIVTVDSEGPSPFSAALLFNYAANYLYDGDAPLAERRAQALTIDFSQLRELLGEAQLRELLDAGAVLDVELTLQSLGSARGVRSADGVHDLLLRLGDLSFEELMARIELPADEKQAGLIAWLQGLQTERRVILVTIGGDARYVAAEDAARYRDALGVALPQGLPEAFLTSSERPLIDLVSRYARSHGPFQLHAIAQRFGMGVAAVTMALALLRDEGRLLDGEFRPGAMGQEWCDPEVLSLLRRRSLARLRKQVEPASPVAYARLIMDWQGVETHQVGPGGPDALLDVIEQLQGAIFPASILESDVLPSRLPGYQPRNLDELCAAGEVVWVGHGGLGERDGRLALYLASSLPLLSELSVDPRDGEPYEKVRAYLRRYGASFYHDLDQALDGFVGKELLDTLWDLIWNGELVNDSPSALRAYLAVPRSPTGRNSRRPLAFRSRRLAPPSSVGRWSLRHGGRDQPGRSATERAAALVEQLLSRYGVLSRAAVAAEGVTGGFTAVYPVLHAMEESGKLRRGYFIQGLGGSQFAHPPALDRLRMLRDDPVERDHVSAIVLAAADPANPYGAVLPWPKTAEPRSPFARSAGAYVVLQDGELLAFIGRGEKSIVTTLPEHEPRRSELARGIAVALELWARTRFHYQPGWQLVDGQPLMQSVLGPFLREAGFVPSGPGVRLAVTPRVVAAGDHA